MGCGEFPRAAVAAGRRARRLQRGARSPEFQETGGLDEALANVRWRGIEALVVSGGNGSQAGSKRISQAGSPVVGIASTIDNDLIGTDVTIGVDTAVNIRAGRLFRGRPAHE